MEINELRGAVSEKTPVPVFQKQFVIDLEHSGWSKPIMTPLMHAAAMGNIEFVKELLEEGADVDTRGPRGSTALMFAAGSGHVEIVKLLIESGANVSLEEAGGWTALRHALEDGEHQVAEYLQRASSI